MYYENESKKKIVKVSEKKMNKIIAEIKITVGRNFDDNISRQQLASVSIYFGE